MPQPPAARRFWQLDATAPEAIALQPADQAAVRYGPLACLADQVAQDLAPRRAFALEAAPTVATIAVYLGALRRGAVPLLVDPLVDDASRQALYARYGIERAFDGRCDTHDREAIAAHWRATGVPAQAAVDTHPDLAVLLSTSGSTGSGKLVRLSHDNLATNAASIVSYLDLDEQEVAITSLPLHYSYGLSVLNSHLACGARVVLTDATVVAPAFWTAMQAHGVTSLSAVPTLWRMLQRLRIERMDLPALRTFTQAGGKLDPEEVRALHACAASTGRRLIVMYGQTEAAPRMAWLPPDRLPDKAGSIGQAIPGGRLSLVDPNGQPVTRPGEVGELVYEGPNVMLGYAESAQDLRLGAMVRRLHTGDLASRDADGDLWIAGRIRRFIKLHGHRISLDEVEAQLRRQGLEAGVTGRDDVLMVGVVGLASSGLDALRQSIAHRLRCPVRAVRVSAVDALPTGGNGKLRYAELMRLIDPGTPAASPPSAPPGPAPSCLHAD